MEFADRVAQACYTFYDKLPAKFKPNPSQWTVTTFILKLNDLSVVSFGSGTKCVGEHSMSSTGNILNDSHAEIMARRGFLLYIYDQIENAFKNNESIFFLNDSSSKKCVLKDGTDFIFFSTQVPCGDCSIMPMKRKSTFSDPIQTKIIKLDLETETDIYRTGAKCLPGAEQDPCLNGESYHLLAQIRTKPGRGDRTLSLSCSDKIARWMRVGIQGALISRLIDHPVVIKAFVFGGGIPYSEESIKRAVIYRDKDGDYSTDINDCTHDYPHGHLLKMPTFYQSSLIFIDGKDNQKKPCPLSVVYWNGDPPHFEITVNGQMQGTTKKNASKLSAAPAISKSKIFLKFLSFIEETEDSYCSAKNDALEYQRCWKTVKRKFFKTWTKKPALWNFKKCDLL